MSKLQDLIKELCPEGVEFRKLGEVFSRLRGTPITAAKMKEIESVSGNIRIFAGGKTVINANEEDIPNANITRVPAVLVQSRGVIDVVFYDKPFTFKNEMWAYTAENVISTKYLYYVLKNNIEYFRKAASNMGSLPQISLSVTENFEIPLPPLEVQNEIVRILDTFTSHAAELQAKLQAELQARKEQYEYYRNKLLAFDENDEGVKWKKLGEICENYDKKRKPVTASNRKPGPYPYYGASGIVDYVASYIFDGNFLLISEDGANLLARSTPIAFSIKGKNWVNNHAHILKFHNTYTQKYTEYYINMIDISQYVTGGAQPKLNQENLNKISIPIPPLAEQQRIVSILDKFEALVNDLSAGLPAEIAAVQEQYEYYRNKLLTFERKS